MQEKIRETKIIFLSYHFIKDHWKDETKDPRGQPLRQPRWPLLPL